MNYIIVSTAVTDETYPFGNTQSTISLGGAGTYALVGMKIWTDEVSLITGVGADFDHDHGKWFRENKVNLDHVRIKHEKTPKTIVNYFVDGERIETPAFGVEHYRLMEASVEEIEAGLHSEIKGIYIFKEADVEFWSAVKKLRQAFNFKLMWEINADSAKKEMISEVKQIAEGIDILSINVTEAKTLLNKHDVTEVISDFLLWNVPYIFLRDGAKGAYIIYENKFIQIPSVENVNVADVTGGGNSSSAGVLFGLCEGYSPFESGVIGSISASICLEQKGVPALIDDKVRKRARELLKVMR